MRTVLYVGNFALPDGGAQCERVLSNAKALCEAGYAVLLGGNLPYPDTHNFTSAVWNVRYFHIDEEIGMKSCTTKLGRYLSYGSELSAWVSRTIEQHPVEAVILSTPYSHNLLRLRGLCKRKQVTLICDVMEWQDPIYCDKGRFHLHRLDVELSLRFLIPRVGNVIAISSYLNQYFSHKGCRVMCIPPLIDSQEKKWDVANNARTRATGQRVRLLFSGSWERDRHDIFLKGLQILRNRGHLVQLDYLGCTRDHIARYDSDCRRLLNELGEAVVFHGRVPFADVHPISASADFGLLLRDSRRWSNACFPSKTPQFQMLGVPMISNITSDLGEYLKDHENAIIVQEVSVEAWVKAVEKALALSPAQLNCMRDSSRRLARQRFDYHHYIGSLAKFIQGLHGETPDRNSTN
jgi:glycosyltransferase involved in cell wall biosynthesis